MTENINFYGFSDIARQNFGNPDFNGPDSNDSVIVFVVIPADTMKLRSEISNEGPMRDQVESGIWFLRVMSLYSGVPHTLQ